MATRQYIGARYVPKFYQNSVDGSTAWEANVVYEPLTYVTLQNGHMYISKKEVPATIGTPASNVDYWLDVGDYNGFIEELQNQIDAIDDELDILKNRRFIFVSDSYGARTYSDKTLIQCIAQFAGIPSTNYVSVQQNGSGFIGLSGVDNFLTKLQGATIPFANDEVTDIIVMGGANDITESESDVLTAIGTFCSYCKGRFSNAKIRLAHVGRFWEKARHDLTVGVSIPAWRKCALYGANYITNSEYILHNRGYMDVDNAHPNGAGVMAIAMQIANAIITNGICDVHYKTAASLNVTNGSVFTTVTKTGSSPILISVDNDITTVKFGAENIVTAQLGTPQTFGTTIAINDIMTLVQTDELALMGNITQGNNTIANGIPVTIGITTTDGVVGNTAGVLNFGSDGKAYLNIQNRFVPNNSTNVIVLVQIYVASCTMEIPSYLC